MIATFKRSTTCIFIAVLIKLAIVFISLDSVNSGYPETLATVYDKAVTVRFRAVSITNFGDTN